MIVNDKYIQLSEIEKFLSSKDFSKLERLLWEMNPKQQKSTSTRGPIQTYYLLDDSIEVYWKLLMNKYKFSPKLLSKVNDFQLTFKYILGQLFFIRHLL